MTVWSPLSPPDYEGKYLSKLEENIYSSALPPTTERSIHQARQHSYSYSSPVWQEEMRIRSREGGLVDVGWFITR